MKWEMIKMHFYKNKNDNFFLQFDEEVQDSEELLHVLVEKHEGDETKHQPIITKEKVRIFIIRSRYYDREQFKGAARKTSS